MSILMTVLDFIALATQLIGSWLMFNNSPINIPSGLIFGDGDTIVPKRKNRRLKMGFLILAIGFLIAFIALTLKNFVPNGI